MGWELDCNPTVKHIAQVQAKKLVEDIDKKGMNHFLKMPGGVEEEVFLIPMRKWQELRRQVGLE